MMGLASAKVSSVTNSSLSSSKTSAQALQYAETQADIVRNTAYDDLSSKAKAQIAGTHFYEEVTVSAEAAYKEDIKKKDCTVNIYSGSETIPRATLTITRLTKEENQAIGVPVGTVLSWYGKLADIPEGFALCDGTNGTPDLRDRFVVGAGGEYALGATGGEKEVKLEATQIGNHYHAVGSYNFGSNNGAFLSLGMVVLLVLIHHTLFQPRMKIAPSTARFVILSKRRKQKCTISVHFGKKKTA